MSRTFNETYFEFDESIDRLDEQIAELRAEIEELADDNPATREKRAQIQRLKKQRKGAKWALNEAYESEDFPAWDEDVDGVTLAALRAGSYGGLINDVERDPDAGGGTSTNLIVAEATVEAPYIDDGMSERKRTAAVASLHPFYVDWADARIGELLDPEAGNGNF